MSDISKVSWEKLRTLYAVATLGSFSRAAESLQTTQATVSRRIKELEEILQITLVERSTSRFKLTPTTLNIVEELASMEASFHKICSSLRETAGQR